MVTNSTIDSGTCTAQHEYKCNSIFRDLNGRIHVVYSKQDGSSNDQIYYAYSDNEGTSWSSPTQLTSDTRGANSQQYPGIVGLSNGDLMVVWSGKSSSSTTTFQIRYCFYDESAATWGTPTDITAADAGYNQYVSGRGQIDVDSEDTVHLIYYGYREPPDGYGQTHIKYRSWTSGGGWSAKVEVYSDSYDSYEPVIAVDSADGLHAAWAGGSSTPYIQYSYHAYGGSWGGAETVCDDTYTQYAPCLAIDANDDVHCALAGIIGTGTYYDVRYNKRTSGSWGSVQNLTSSDNYDQYPTPISISSDGYIHVIMCGKHSGSTTYKQLRYRYSDDGGASFEAITSLTSDSIQHWNPISCTGIHNRINPDIGYILVWFDDTNKDAEFYGDAQYGDPPDAITDLDAVGGQNEIVLDWTEPDDNGSSITDYKVYEGATSGSETYLCNTGSTSPTYTRTGLGNNVHKYYKVAAVNAFGTAELSNEADATTNASSTQNDNYEYKLEVGSLTSESDAIYLRNWSLKNPKNRPMSASLELVKTADALSIEVMDQVKFYRRIAGETTWGDTLFFGRVTSPVYSTRGTVRLECKDYLDRIFRRRLSGPAFGDTHTVDKEYTVTCVKDVTYEYNKRIYANLGEADQMAVPLECVKVLQMKEYVSGGYSRDTITAWTSVSDAQIIAQTFTARPGILRKIWFKGYRATGATNTVNVSIQADSNGLPNGTDIAVVTLAAGDYGNGSGNEGWIEVDFLRNVSPATVLNLTPGQQYWIVFEVTGASGNLYYHRCVKDRPTPQNRFFLTSNDGGSNWSKVTDKYSLLFGIDFEGDWVELPPDAYLLKTTASMQTLYITRWNWDTGDDEHFGNIQGYIVPEFLYDAGAMKFLRCSHWMGALVFADVLEDWAYHLASDLFDTLTINVTEPDAKCYCIDHKEGTGLQSWIIITNYAPYVIRLYMNEDGDRVLEIIDERAPTTTIWNNYSTDEKAVRTFCHGFNSPTDDDEVRIVEYEVAKEMVSEEDTIVTRDAGGNIGGLISCGSQFSQTTGNFGSFAGNLGDGLNMASYLYESVKTIKQSGWIKLSGVNQTLTDRPFVHCNELIKLTLDDFGLDEAIMAVNMVILSGGIGKVTETTISFLDYTWTVKERSSAPGHGTVSNPGQSQESEKSKKLKTLADLEAFSDYRPGGGMGASDCPISSAPMRSDTRALQDGMALQDLTLEPDITDFHRITLGTGTPTGTTLGNQVCAVNADYPLYPFNDNEETIIMAYISDADFDPATAWPVIITEVGVESAPSETGPWTEVWAASIAIDGTGDLVSHQPEMVPSRRLAVSIHAGVYIPS